MKSLKNEPKPKITDFKLDKVIGIGHFGKVLKAWNKSQKRWVALKVLKKESVAEMSHVEHVINEREVLFYLREANTYRLRYDSMRRRKESQCSDDEWSDDEPTLQCPYLM